MVQYLLTSIRYKMEAYETNGGLFKFLKQDYTENKLNIKSLAVISLVIDALEKMPESIVIEIITRKTTTNIEDFGFLISRDYFNYQ